MKLVFLQLQMGLDPVGCLGVVLLARTCSYRLRDRLAEDNPEKAKDFVQKAQKEVKSYILPKLKDCEYFVGESMNHEAMVALLDYREDGNTPYMIFFKDGLEMEKC